LIVRHTFAPHNNTRLSHLCGPMDAHLRTIEAALQVSIAHRKNSSRWADRNPWRRRPLHVRIPSAFAFGAN
jgi:phosphate starvation-inducible protein PhoH